LTLPESLMAVLAASEMLLHAYFFSSLSSPIV